MRAAMTRSGFCQRTPRKIGVHPVPLRRLRVAWISPIDASNAMAQPARNGKKPVPGESSGPRPYCREPRATAMPTTIQIAPLTWSLLNLAMESRPLLFPETQVSDKRSDLVIHLDQVLGE